MLKLFCNSFARNKKSQSLHKINYLHCRRITFNKNQNMTDNNKKQFGVWMDTQQATIVGKEDLGNGEFIVVGHVSNDGAEGNSNERTSNNQEIASTQKFFKEIAGIMPNIDEIHITGTGQIQEQFIHFLQDTAQYKNVKSTDSTSNKMSDESLKVFITEHFK